MRSIAVLLISIALGGAEPPLTDALTRQFDGRSGAAIVLDVASGAVIAAYHPDVAAGTLTRPGSTVKPFVISALLERGILKPSTQYQCRRQLTLLGRDMACTHDRLPGSLTPATAIAYSCNSYVTHFGGELTPDDLARALRAFGLATRTGLLPGEATGEITLPSSHEAQQLQAIGETNILVTPVGLAESYRHLALRIHDPVLQPVFDGMIRSVTEGTGQLAASDKIEIAGKTGTTLTMDGGRRQAWFAGFAPARDPKIVFVIFVPQGSGAHDAAPIAKPLVEAWAKSR